MTNSELYTHLKRLAVYWLPPTKLPRASKKHSGDEQTKDDNENSELATVSKKSANVYYVFKKYVHQTFNDKSPLLLATSLCLSLVSVMKFVLNKYVH